MKHTILLVDDEQHVVDGLKRALHKEPYEILAANSAEEAAEILDEHSVDVIVSDEEMPGMSGTEFLGKVASEWPEVVRIVLTGSPSLPAALRAINEGKVYQFFTKPCNEIDLAITIRRALEQKDLTAKSRELLEVSKRQVSIIQETRMRRRLSGRGKESTVAAGASGFASGSPGLIAEIDEHIRTGRNVIESLDNNSRSVQG